MLGSKLTRKSDGHVLDSYIMLYLEPIAQLEEHLTFNQRVARFKSCSVHVRKIVLK